MRSLRQQIWRLGHAFIGSRAWDCYQEFLRLGEGDSERLRRLSEERLERLLRHAARHVPYYRDRIGVRGDDIAGFPVLSKDDVRRNFRQLMSPELAVRYPERNRGYSWTEVQTGGTSGVPTTVIHDRRFRDFGRAARLYSQYLSGFPYGTPYFRLWGSMREIAEIGESRLQRALRWLSAETLLNAFRMDPGRMRAYLAQINASPVRHMMAYVDCAAELARFARREGIPVRGLDSIMACAGAVTEDVRRLLAETFGARIHNNYGSRDCSAMACECASGGLHIYTNHVYLEVVDESGRPVPAGQTGRLLVTLLNNYDFPLIRYQIGDVGALARSQCRCGLAWPLLDRVEGRIEELLYTPSGAYLSPVYVRHLVGVVHNPGIVRRFQLVQQDRRDYLLRLEVDEHAGPEMYASVASALVRDLEAVLGADCRVRVRREERIEEAASGKFRYVVSELATVKKP